MTFPQACQAYHDHQLTTPAFWDYLTQDLHIPALLLRLGLFLKIQLWCGGA
jgi:hypothetical protein